MKVDEPTGLQGAGDCCCLLHKPEGNVGVSSKGKLCRVRILCCRIIFTDETVHLIPVLDWLSNTEGTLLFERKYWEGKEGRYFRRILLVDFASCSVL